MIHYEGNIDLLSNFPSLVLWDGPKYRDLSGMTGSALDFLGVGDVTHAYSIMLAFFSNWFCNSRSTADTGRKSGPSLDTKQFGNFLGFLSFIMTSNFCQ